MRLVLDANVLASATIQKDYPYFIVDRFLPDPNFKLCISEELFAEFVAGLNREKFAKYPYNLRK